MTLFFKGRSLLVLFCLVLSSGRAFAQAPTFAGNAQHTSIYAAPAQNLNLIKWSTSIDLNNTGALIHYGAPLVSAANTVFVPVKTGTTNGFRVDAIDGATGAAKYSLTTDYILPAHVWMPSYQPTIAGGPFGPCLYYAGAGGTIWHVDNPDSPTHLLLLTCGLHFVGRIQRDAAAPTTASYQHSITADSPQHLFWFSRAGNRARASQYDAERLRAHRCERQRELRSGQCRC